MEIWIEIDCKIGMNKTTGILFQLGYFDRATNFIEEGVCFLFKNYFKYTTPLLNFDQKNFEAIKTEGLVVVNKV